MLQTSPSQESVRKAVTFSPRLISRPKRKTAIAVLQQDTYTTIVADFHYKLRTIDHELGFDDDCNEVNKQRQIETSISIHPKPWLLGRGFALSYSTSGNSWIPQFGFQFRHYNIRSEEALVFEFCSFGNLEGLKSLLRRGDASPFDCDLEGWTPLHVCSSRNHPDHGPKLTCGHDSTQRRHTTKQFANYLSSMELPALCWTYQTGACIQTSRLGSLSNTLRHSSVDRPCTLLWTSRIGPSHFQEVERLWMILQDCISHRLSASSWKTLI